MMNLKMPAQLVLSAELSYLLFEAARRTALATAKHTFRREQPRGVSLSPGEQTPMWNALTDAVESHLCKRGDRVNLARDLGLPRQRITEMLRSKTYLPDAERTMQLLVWLNNHQHRKEKDVQ